MSNKARTLATLGLAAAFIGTQSLPALATIDNTATAQGTTGSGAVSGTNPLTNFGTSGKVSVPVQAGNPTLQVTAAVALGTTSVSTTGSSVVGGTITGCTVSTSCTYSAAGNTLTITYTVKNTGNVTINNAYPTDAVGIQDSATPGTSGSFANGTGTLSGITLVTSSLTGGATQSGVSGAAANQANLPPGATAQYTATYTLSAQDVYTVAGLTGGTLQTSPAISATGTPAIGTLSASLTSSGNTNITGLANLSIVKTAVYDGVTATASSTPTTKAALGDNIAYNYAVTNSGTVTMYNVQVSDIHGQELASPAVISTTGTASGIGGGTLTTPSPTGATASSSSAGSNGSWPVLGAGATVGFTWSHAVTQPEIDKG